MLGKNLDKILKNRRIGIRELAKGSGVPASTISKWISSNQEPKASALLKVAKYLSVSMEALLEGEGKVKVKAQAKEIPKELYGAFASDFFEVFQGEFRITVERKKD